MLGTTIDFPMKKFGLTIFASILLGVMAFAGIFFWQKGRIDREHQHATAFEWLSQEFSLTEAQSRRVEALHAEYFPECEDHCIHYTDSRKTLAKVTEDPDLDDSPEHVAAARRLAELEKEADKRFIDFVYKVAAEMEAEQSRRYLQRMKGWLERSGGE